MEEIKAIPFIKYTPKGFQLTEESVKFLLTLKNRKIGIISMVGKYRTGKSYFINKVLLRKQNAFTVDSTINACTKGIWLWPQIIKADSSD